MTGRAERRTRVAGVMTVFNRRETTLACLRSIDAQQGLADVDVDVYVVDDASPDGTAEAVARDFPEAHLLRGSGDLFWNGGMRLAFGAALDGDYDYYWWLNDDTHLDDDALARLLDTARSLEGDGRGPAIVVGSTRHPDDGRLTYGGVRVPSPVRPLKTELVAPGDEPRPAETMNGNCVLIPAAVAAVVGNLDPAFVQKMGDFDYGFRARAAGFGVWVAPGTIGECATHPPRRTDEQPLWDEIRRLWSTKELPPGPWATFVRRHAGPLWPLYFVSPYVRRSARLIGERVTQRQARTREATGAQARSRPSGPSRGGRAGDG